jgi:uncharacterized protein (DUF2235 family)
MFGAGIDSAITNAYEWPMENYHPGDEVFIFGFSRGAYTARSPSGFVSKCGLLQNGRSAVNQIFMRHRRPGSGRLSVNSNDFISAMHVHSNAHVSKPASLAALVPAPKSTL